MSGEPLAEIVCEWAGPFEWADTYRQEAAQAPGLYLWTLRTPVGRVGTYLGETGVSIAHRLRAHERMYWTGEYGLRDWEAFLRGEDRLFKPSYYRTYTSVLRAEFQERLDHWRPIIEAEMAGQELFLLPIPNWTGPDYRNLRMRLEKALGTEIIRLWPPSFPNLFDGWDEYRSRPQSEPMIALFSGELPLDGMRSELVF